MGNALSNEGKFTPPGARAVAAYTAECALQTDPRWIAYKATENRLRAMQAEESKALAKPKYICSICRSQVDDIVANPWQQTNTDLRALELSDDSDAVPDKDAGGIVVVERRRRAKRGIKLNPCLHVFCGACFAQYIYNNLDVQFDSEAYGTKLDLRTPKLEAKLIANTHFPMGCPTCQKNPGEKLVEISDVTAKLVLGEANMEVWNHARLVSKMSIVYCPYQDCSKPFDTNSIVPAVGRRSKHAKGRAECPSCRRSLCKDCEVKWHDKMTCAQYQALPAHERTPEDVALLALVKEKKWRQCSMVRLFCESVMYRVNLTVLHSAKFGSKKRYVSFPPLKLGLELELITCSGGVGELGQSRHTEYLFVDQRSHLILAISRTPNPSFFPSLPSILMLSVI